MTEVIAINRMAAMALFSDDTTAPVTNWLDADGDECAADDAIVCVVGPDPRGKWHSVDLCEFDPVETQ